MRDLIKKAKQLQEENTEYMPALFFYRITIANSKGFNFIQQKSPTFIRGGMNAIYLIQWECKLLLNEVKASGGCHRFSEEVYRASSIKSGRNSRQGVIDPRNYWPPLFTEEVAHMLRSEKFESLPTLTETWKVWKKEGLEEGMKEGIERGLKEGEKKFSR